MLSSKLDIKTQCLHADSVWIVIIHRPIISFRFFTHYSTIHRRTEKLACMKYISKCLLLIVFPISFMFIHRSQEITASNRDSFGKVDISCCFIRSLLRQDSSHFSCSINEISTSTYHYRVLLWSPVKLFWVETWQLNWCKHDFIPAKISPPFNFHHNRFFFLLSLSLSHSGNMIGAEKCKILIWRVWWFITCGWAQRKPAEF